MPRPNQLRSVLAERHLARRVAVEREARAWTYEGLAKRMTDAGCSLTGSAIFKIEKGDPPRRIVVDELVAFSEVFGLPVAELLVPPEFSAQRRLQELFVTWVEKRNFVTAASLDEQEDYNRLIDEVRAHPELHELMTQMVTTWVEEQNLGQGTLTHTLYELLGTPETRDAYINYCKSLEPDEVFE